MPEGAGARVTEQPKRAHQSAQKQGGTYKRTANSIGQQLCGLPQPNGNGSRTPSRLLANSHYLK